MASTNPSIDLSNHAHARAGHTHTAAGTLLIGLRSVSLEGLDTTLSNIALALPGQSTTVAVPEGTPHTSLSFPSDSLRLVHYAPSATSNALWVVTAADFLNLYKLVEEHGASACLTLGSECHSLSHEAIQSLAESVLLHNADLATPRYHLGPHDGLVNSALLYPVSRALFGARPRFPLALDLGLSARMAQKMAATSQKFTSVNQNEALLWPVAEAAAANYTIVEVDAGHRTLPPPASPDLNSLLSQIVGSLFTDLDAKAAFWQRSRTVQSAQTFPVSPLGQGAPDIAPMIEAFRLAYTNLQEIWSLVLPPAALLGLKRLSQMPPTAFRMADSLWARVVYDFILAFRLRTINRGHLLGALTPLYLAWVASHILLLSENVSPEAHIQAQAATFETEKPYLVSRWRWPDRFNP